jgi:hypothetical protein
MKNIKGTSIGSLRYHAIQEGNNTNYNKLLGLFFPRSDLINIAA